MTKISDDVLVVLGRSTAEGNILRLPDGQLPRPLYLEVAKVIEANGGKWNRKANAHLFDEGDDAEAILDQAITTGEFSRKKQDFGQFDSPPEVVAKVIRLAEIREGNIVLEPSAGLGALAHAAAELAERVDCVESDPKRVTALRQAGFFCAAGDFLTCLPSANGPLAFSYDRVVMNPPFARQADIEHVMHAHKFLRPGGLLVSVMSMGIMHRVNQKTAEFRRFCARHGGTDYPLPPDAFKASGTMVRTCIVRIPA